MAGQPNGPKYTLEHLEELTIEQLEKLLCASVDFSDSDEEYIDAIVDAIVKKERENPTGRLPKVDEAWRSFQENFNTEEGEGLSLYPDDVEEQPPVQLMEKRKGKPKIRWNRLVAAVAILLICAVAVAPPALGYRDFFAMVGHWNQSIFSFFGGGQEPEISEGPEDASYDSLQEALDAYGITTPVVPVIPEGYQVIAVDVRQSPAMGKINFNALYQNGNLFISIHIIYRNLETTRGYEKDESLVEEYEVNGIIHYISQNNGKLCAAWYTGNLECSLQTEISIDELKLIINSIYER